MKADPAFNGIYKAAQLVLEGHVEWDSAAANGACSFAAWPHAVGRTYVFIRFAAAAAAAATAQLFTEAPAKPRLGPGDRRSSSGSGSTVPERDGRAAAELWVV